MNDANQLLWGMLFGAFGLGFFIYGKKQGATVPLLCGIGLFIVPYIVTSVPAMIMFGTLLCVLPFLIKK